MTAQTEAPTTLPREVIAQDARYEQTITDGETAVVERDRLRWEWTRCPNGPMFSFAEYGRQVGRSRDTIRRSVDAVTESRAARQSDTCNYDHARFVPKKKATKADAKKHKEAKHRVSAGEVGSIVVRTLAVLSGKSENTIEHNATWTPLQQEAKERVRKEVVLDTEETAEQITTICAEVYQAYKDQEAAVARAKKWMAENRSVPASEVSMANAREMVSRIARVAKRKRLSFADAEAETREWDRKEAEAERIKNEHIKAARLAVLDLRRSAAQCKDDGLKVAAAVRKIEQDEIPLTDDERELAMENLDDAESAIRLARASLGGESGTDWDDELRRLAGDRS